MECDNKPQKIEILQKLPYNHYKVKIIETQEIIEIKKCTKKDCPSPFRSLDEFAVSKPNGDGLMCWCKSCKLESRRRPVLFKKFAHIISYADPVREVNGLLETTCTYCGAWFNPTGEQISSRRRALEGRTTNHSYAENRFYCSKLCKKECPVFNKRTRSADDNSNFGTSREVQPELRQMVFERDNYTCQRCKKHQSELDVPLHCHHIEGILWDPLESADIDKCLTECKTCHKEIHSIEGCRYHDYRCPIEFKVTA